MNTNEIRSGELIQSVIETLAQGESLLVQLTDEEYTRKVAVAFNASVGGHYRHCLDHFRSLLDSAMQGDLNYDHRERGTLIEHDRFAALNATRELRDAYERFDPDLLARPLCVTCKTSYSTKDSQASSSTVGREIMYSVAHAVHHYALIGVMCGVMGLKMPVGFGVAPSTLKHQTALAADVRSKEADGPNMTNAEVRLLTSAATGYFACSGLWCSDFPPLLIQQERFSTPPGSD